MKNFKHLFIKNIFLISFIILVLFAFHYSNQMNQEIIEMAPASFEENGHMEGLL